MKIAERILLFTGNGKGKTTAALGMALRASGHGMRTVIFQFIKSDQRTGEIAAIRHLPGMEIVQLGRGFVPDRSSPAFDGHCRAAEEGLQRARLAMASGGYDLVILDEIANAVAKGLVEESPVIEAIRATSPETVVVLTGRGASAGLLELADTVTEMRAVKHGFSVGRPARQGVEY
jgi:cob(I)alamin adenosyltransferase